MELIKDKIKENVKKQKELMEVADEIQVLRQEQDKILRAYEVILQKMVGKLTNERIITKIFAEDLIKESGRYTENKSIIGINQAGIGYISRYSKNLSTYRGEQAREILTKGATLLKSYFKGKTKALEILKIFEENLVELNSIIDVKCDFKVNKNDFNDTEKGTETAEFDTRQPYNITGGSGYHEMSIENIENYIMVEDKYDDIKKKYEETIELMTQNNVILNQELTKISNAFSPWFVAEAL